MDPNMNSQDLQQNESVDNYHSFASNSSPQTQWQDSSTPRFRGGQGHYQGPYPTSNPRMRQHGDFQQRGRYSYNKRGGGPHRSYNRDEQSSDNPSNRNFNKFVRPNMLEDPWAYMKAKKVPSNGTTLVFDTPNP